MAYSKNKTICGIYKITNQVNEKVYIGQSNNIYKRWAEHKRLGANGDKCSLLYKAIRKYGVDQFSFEIIEKCDESLLDDREQYYIRYYNSYVGWENSWGYNQSIGGKSNRGYHPTERTKNLWSQHRTGEGNGRALAVVCDNQRFGTIKECAEFYGIEKTVMQRWLSKECSMPYNFVLKQLRFEGTEFSCRKGQNCHYVMYDIVPYDSFTQLAKTLGVKAWMLPRYIQRKRFPVFMVGHSLVVDGEAIDTSISI